MLLEPKDVGSIPAVVAAFVMEAKTKMPVCLGIGYVEDAQMVKINPESLQYGAADSPVVASTH